MSPHLISTLLTSAEAQRSGDSGDGAWRRSAGAHRADEGGNGDDDDAEVEANRQFELGKALMLHIVELVPKCAAMRSTAGARSTPIGAADATNLAEALTFSDLSTLGRGDVRCTLKTLEPLLLLQGTIHQIRGSHDGRLLC